MPTKVVDVQDAQETLAELISLVEAGTDIILTEGKRPRARLTAITSKHGRVPGLHSGSIWISDDFDEPLSEEFWLSDEAPL